MLTWVGIGLLRGAICIAGVAVTGVVSAELIASSVSAADIVYPAGVGSITDVGIADIGAIACVDVGIPAARDIPIATINVDVVAVIDIDRVAGRDVSPVV